MRARRLVAVLGTCTALTVLAACDGGSGNGGSEERSTADRGNSRRVDLSAVEAFDAFTVFYLGNSFRGLSLTNVFSQSSPDRGVWFFQYGRLAISVTNWGNRRPSTPADPHGARRNCPKHVEKRLVMPEDTFRLRGAVAGRISFGQLAVYTGDTIVTIGPRGPKLSGLLRPAARALRPVGSDASPDRLPPPAEQLTGAHPCR